MTTAVGGTPLINAEHGSGATESFATGSVPDLNVFSQTIQQMQAEILRLQAMVGSNIPVDPTPSPNSRDNVGSSLDSRHFKRISAFDGDPKQ